MTLPQATSAAPGHASPEGAVPVNPQSLLQLSTTAVPQGVVLTCPRHATASVAVPRVPHASSQALVTACPHTTVLADGHEGSQVLRRSQV